MPGTKPLKEALTKEERRVIGEDIKTLQYRWPLGMPLVRSLGNGLWEIRSGLPTRIARTIFSVSDGKIVLLHGFIKKTPQTPHEALVLAAQRRSAYLQAHEKSKQSTPRKRLR